MTAEEIVQVEPDVHDDGRESGYASLILIVSEEPSGKVNLYYGSQAEVEEMARWIRDAISAAVAEARAEEREECAKVAADVIYRTTSWTCAGDLAEEVAATIRARGGGETEPRPDADALAAAIAELDRLRTDDRGGQCPYHQDAPLHYHLRRGVWDDDNGDLAGKPCEWCAAWVSARQSLAAYRSRRDAK